MKIRTQSELERLTPEGWEHVGISPDKGRGGVRLRGRASNMGWYDFDLKALGLPPQPTTGLSHSAALKLGGEIEKAMKSRAVGDRKRRG